VHLATDHSYSGCRIALQKAILSWLIGLESGSSAERKPAPDRVNEIIND
jgi:hypothetical protein